MLTHYQNSQDYRRPIKRENRARLERRKRWDPDAINKLLTATPASIALPRCIPFSLFLLLCFAAFYYSHNRIWDGDSAGDFGFVYGNAVVGPTMPPLNASLSARTDAHSKLPLAPSPPVIFRNQTIRAMRSSSHSRGAYKSAYIICN